MTTSTEDPARALLLDGFGRIPEGVEAVLDGLSTADLRWRPDAGANPVGWLLWHLARQQDAQLSAVAEQEQAWTAQGWSARFGLPYPDGSVGFGQDADEVAAFAVEDPGLLVGYAAAVHARTVRLLEGLAAQDYGRVVDERWDPPVTLGVRVFSVLADATKHLGQAEYVKGMLGRR
ncbi:mycothiol transferase [Ornithinimicrobium avium]|uniref:DinB family protein n=1 Tax=Ornithinimicrobium avium TaxID=2283195 RepID=A0A345NK60_9MICO|nr:DinB family protein [Ornithinimicrobium avium]AXH95418.1 DinB family protein [Ornithinimicrobium avium]